MEPGNAEAIVIGLIVLIYLSILIIPIWITVVILGRTKRTEAMVQAQGLAINKIVTGMISNGAIPAPKPAEKQERHWEQRRLCPNGHKVRDNETWCAECGQVAV